MAPLHKKLRAPPSCSYFGGWIQAPNTFPSPPALTCCSMSGRREQALEKKYPGLFKPHAPRGLLHGNTVEKLIKKRNVPQKLSPHSKR